MRMAPTSVGKRFQTDSERQSHPADLRDCGKMTRVGSNRNGRWVVRTDWCHRFGYERTDSPSTTDPGDE